MNARQRRHERKREQREAERTEQHGGEVVLRDRHGNPLAIEIARGQFRILAAGRTREDVIQELHEITTERLEAEADKLPTTAREDRLLRRMQAAFERL